MPRIDVAVVGAGAAGLATAIFAARHAPGLRIAALDGARRPGAKILVSGGGRCNVTNTVVTEADFSGGNRSAIRRVLRAFPVTRTLAFFREIGVALHEEEHGKLFPDTHKARTVLHALLDEASRRGVDLLAGHRVTALEAADHGFHVQTSAGAFEATRVVLATGGLSLPKTGSDGGGYALAGRLGHELVPPTPALVPLRLDGEFHRPLSGISQDVVVTLRVEGEPPRRIPGALLWTHFGISGPAALDVSRHWLRARLEGKPAQLGACLLPGDDFASAERFLLELARSRPRLSRKAALALRLPATVAEAILRHLGVDPDATLAHLAREERRRLIHALLDWPLPVVDSRGFGFAEVTAGGVPLEEVDVSAMASRRCPGLFLVGEILDVDGRLGGFNFQWSWSSAWVAGTALARQAEGRTPT